MRARWLLVVLIGCGRYAPDSLLKDRAGTSYSNSRHLGCLDFTTGVVNEVTFNGALIFVDFGNRCDHAVPIDFRKLHVTAGSNVLNARDPRSEIHAARVMAHVKGRVVIFYSGLVFDDDAVCIDLNEMTLEESPSTTAPVCLRIPSQ